MDIPLGFVFPFFLIAFINAALFSSIDFLKTSKAKNKAGIISLIVLGAIFSPVLVIFGVPYYLVLFAPMLISWLNSRNDTPEIRNHPFLLIGITSNVLLLVIAFMLAL
jgi:hypothetical protein